MMYELTIYVYLAAIILCSISNWADREADREADSD